MFEPSGNYPNLLGLTPADRRPKLEEYNIDLGDRFGEKKVYIKIPMRKKDITIPEECSIQHLSEFMFAKAKYRPPTFEEFCEATKNYEDYNINDLEFIHLIEYKDKVVGTLRCKIIVPLDGFGIEKIPSKDIRETIQEYKLQMYHRLTQEYDKKNKEAIKEEKKMMIYIPGMKKDVSESLINELFRISRNVDVQYDMLSCSTKPSGVLKLDIPFENVPRLRVSAPMDKNHWLEGIPAVKKVETYNQRVVKVTFIDDTFTKSVCSENDHFDIDVGITICLLKRFMGANSDNATREYNKTMNYIHAVMEKNEKERLARIEEEKTLKAKKRKIELKRAAKKLKAKEEQIDIQKQAIIRAHQEMEGLEQ